MSRRGNHRRREQRRDRPQPDLPPTPERFDPVRAAARWHGLISTATCRGSTTPLFEKLMRHRDQPNVIVGISDAEIIRRTREQDPS